MADMVTCLVARSTKHKAIICHALFEKPMATILNSLYGHHALKVLHSAQKITCKREIAMSAAAAPRIELL